MSITAATMSRGRVRGIQGLGAAAVLPNSLGIWSAGKDWRLSFPDTPGSNRRRSTDVPYRRLTKACHLALVPQLLGLATWRFPAARGPPVDLEGSVVMRGMRETR
jgi:hypothetical protein